MKKRLTKPRTRKLAELSPVEIPVSSPVRAINPITEMMTRVEFCRGTTDHRILRVRSIAKDGECGPDRRVMDALGTQRHPNDVLAHVNQIMGKLGPDIVAAYEVLNLQGHGFVHYPNWH